MTTTHDPLEDRIRHTLRTVAETADLAPDSRPSPARRRRRWPFAVAVLSIGAPVTLAAAAVVRQGPEYVDAIPPSTILVDDDIDGDRYLVVESRRTDRCGEPTEGVELLRTSRNLIGSEWDMVLVEYGPYRGADCGTDPSAWRDDPARYSDGGLEVGDSFVWHWAVHPDVARVRLSVDGEVVDEVRPLAVDGAGFAFWEVPDGVALHAWTTELVIDGQVVPGIDDDAAPGSGER